MRQVHASGISKLTPAGWYTRKAAATAIGRSRETIKRWEQLGLCSPSGYSQFGSLKVWLYHEDDLDKLRAIGDERLIAKYRDRKPRVAKTI